MKFTDDRSNTLVEYEVVGGTDTYKRRYTHGPGMDNPVKLHLEPGATDKDFTYHADALGSIRLLSDDDKETAISYTYTPYGETTTTIINDYAKVNRFTYTARELETASMLFYRSRYYNNRQGRFFSKDSYFVELEKPITINKYVFVNANPIKYTDSFGYQGKVPRLNQCNCHSVSGGNFQRALPPDPQITGDWACGCSNAFVIVNNTYELEIADFVAGGVNDACSRVAQACSDQMESQLKYYMNSRCNNSLWVQIHNESSGDICGYAYFNSHGFHTYLSTSIIPAIHTGMTSCGTTFAAHALHELSHTVTSREQGCFRSELTARRCVSNIYGEDSYIWPQWEQFAKCQYFKYTIPDGFENQYPYSGCDDPWWQIFNKSCD